MNGIKVAVVIHAFHLDVLGELLSYLENMICKFDLYLNFAEITNTNKEQVYKIREEVSAKFPESCYFSTSDNRGQDLGGFFASTEEARKKKLSYDYVCKIHTKASGSKLFYPIRGGPLCTQTQWRQELLETLLGSKQQVKTIFNIFETYPNMGLISNNKFYCNDFLKFANEKNYNYFMKKLKLRRESCWPYASDFLAGTMFWMRGDIWDFLMNKEITINDFEKGTASDGLKSHAFERIFGAVVRHLDYGVWMF